MTIPPTRPSLLQPSATHPVVAGAGAMAFVVAAALLHTLRPFGNDSVAGALCLLAATAAPIVLLDLVWQRVYRRSSTGMQLAHDDPSWRRTALKYLGLLATLGALAGLYALFPEYAGGFYDHYRAMLRLVLPPLLLLAPPYLFWVDRHMPQPRDGYWQMGKLVMLDWHAFDWRQLQQHLLGWLIKGFFLPLMFSYLCSDLERFLALDFGALRDFKSWLDALYDGFYFLDVGLAALGYLFSLRIIDTHLRSAEPTASGWLVALLCYEPFWSLIGRQYLAYETPYTWGSWLWNTPLLYGLWGCLILMLVAIYVWATAAFGARFSNLTHRGIITSGPYRWSRHPAYLAKNLSWWLMYVPFLAQDGLGARLRSCLLLACLNLVYLLRAKTEERHLARDPDYVAYALWIDEHGLLRGMRHLPLLRLLCFRPRHEEVRPA